MPETKTPRKHKSVEIQILDKQTSGWITQEVVESTAEALKWLEDPVNVKEGGSYRVVTVQQEVKATVQTVSKVTLS